MFVDKGTIARSVPRVAAFAALATACAPGSTSPDLGRVCASPGFHCLVAAREILCSAPSRSGADGTFTNDAAQPWHAGGLYELTCEGPVAPAPVYGTGLYAGSPCNAAVHAGVIDATRGGSTTMMRFDCFDADHGGTAFCPSVHDGITTLGMSETTQTQCRAFPTSTWSDSFCVGAPSCVPGCRVCEPFAGAIAGGFPYRDVCLANLWDATVPGRGLGNGASPPLPELPRGARCAPWVVSDNCAAVPDATGESISITGPLARFGGNACAVTTTDFGFGFDDPSAFEFRTDICGVAPWDGTTDFYDNTNMIGGFRWGRFEEHDAVVIVCEVDDV